MARRFQTRLTIATSVLIAATIGFMSLALIHLAATTITKQHRIRGKLLTALAKRNIEYGTGLPEEVMERVGDQMVVTALLTAELVAIAEQDGSLSPERISEALSRVIERSRQHRGYPLVDEFWVTDENGYAYIHTEDFDFTFSPDPEKTPQANEFWPLLEEGAAPLVQKLQKRAVDEKRFKYVGVSGVDKPRIVQIGVGEDLVNSIQSGFLVENIVERFVEEMEIERIVVADKDGMLVAAASASKAPPETVADAEAMRLCSAFLRNVPEEGVAFGRLNGHVAVLTLLAGPNGDASRALLVAFPTQRMFALLRSRIFLIAVVAGVMILTATLVSIRLSRGLSKPILQLLRGAEEFGDGDFGHRIHLETADEIQVLGEAFNRMADSVQGYMGELERETARRERLESELRIAAELQRSLLPERPPQLAGLELVGWSRSARQVGGDFYDYVEMGVDRLGVMIGDASGKGLPAALLINECSGVLSALGNELRDTLHRPSQLLFRTNNALCRRLGSTGRFVTLFLMVIDVSQGLLRYSVAGHNPPILIGSDPSRRRSLTSRVGFPLGIVRDCKFEDIDVPLVPLDTVLLYSDGLTEARRSDNGRYGDERLRTALEHSAGCPLGDVVAAIRQDVEQYMGAAEMKDDMTVVSVRFCP